MRPASPMINPADSFSAGAQTLSNNCACSRIAETGLRTSCARLVAIRPSSASRSACLRLSLSSISEVCVSRKAAARLTISRGPVSGKPRGASSPPIPGSAASSFANGRVTLRPSHSEKTSDNAQNPPSANRASSRFQTGSAPCFPTFRENQTSRPLSSAKPTRMISP